MIRKLMGHDWMAGVLLPLMVLLMEACWVYPWLSWLGKLPAFAWQRAPLSLVSLIVLLGVSFLATRFFLGRRWHRRWIPLAVVASGLLVVFLVVRVEYGTGYGVFSGRWFSFMAEALLDVFTQGSFQLHPVLVALSAAVYLWWRGMKWGRSSFSFSEVYRGFIIGVVALVILVMAWVLSSVYGSLGNMLAAVGLYVAGFFFFGLAALALGNYQIVRQKTLGQEEATPLFSRRWLSLLFVVIGSIVLLGIGLVSIFSVDAIAGLIGWLSLVGDWLFRLLYYVFIPIGYLVAGLVYAARYLISLFPGREPPGPVQPFNPLDIEPGPEPERDAPRELTFPPELILAIKWGLLAIVAAAVVYLLARAVSRSWSSRARDDVEEIQESLWSWDIFRADLRLFLNAMRNMLKRKRKPTVPAPPVPAGYYDEIIPEHPDIRGIYRHLLWEAARAGITRRRYETPGEYATRLEQVVPEGKGQLAYLTQLYARARYGDLTAPARPLARANRLWRSLCGRLRAL